MERNQNDRSEPRTDANRGHGGPAPDRDAVMREIEASETDGKGTGGMGADAGGWEPLPEDEPGA
ncbi:MAG TPA: hypothetical protein VGR37_22680 [Longimicrobiaceae bacterium]|nr:hypothetical protein [Longimicrobiaceae bacterium]